MRKSAANGIRKQHLNLLLGYAAKAGLLATEFTLLPAQLSLLRAKLTLPPAELALLTTELGCLSRG